MKVAIIGAGFSGLSAAYYLSKQGVNVCVFEASNEPGGLAGSFKENGWKYRLEEHYHHLFTNDSAILSLAEEIGQSITYRSPEAATYFDMGIYKLDSPLSLLKFPLLSYFDRLRTGVGIAFLKISPYRSIFEKITSEKMINILMGNKSWKILWEPLFQKKFGIYRKEINAAWFWARIKKRTVKLGYPDGGFYSFAKKIENEIIKNNGNIFYNTKVISVQSNIQTKLKTVKLDAMNYRKKLQTGGFTLTTKNKKYTFDKVVCTLPAYNFVNIVKGLPNDYERALLDARGLGAINLVLSLNKPFLPGSTYWLNINDRKMPILAIVEHTNFIEKTNYNGSSLVYVANYLPRNHKYFNYDKNQLFNEYYPYLKSVSREFSRKNLTKMYLFKAEYAQPVVMKNHIEKVPAFETPIKNLYLCNIQQVYPWDRGTNYAVENGRIVSKLVLKS